MTYSIFRHYLRAPNQNVGNTYSENLVRRVDTSTTLHVSLCITVIQAMPKKQKLKLQASVRLKPSNEDKVWKQPKKDAWSPGNLKRRQLKRTDIATQEEAGGKLPMINIHMSGPDDTYPNKVKAMFCLHGVDSKRRTIDATKYHTIYLFELEKR